MKSALAGLRVLIVEDESMISMLIEELVVEMGCSVVGIAAELDEALAKVTASDFDAAIVDVNLNGSKSYPVADALKAKGVPFVMATGYGAAGVSEPYRNVPILGKPFRQEHLERALHAAVIAARSLPQRPGCETSALSARP